MHEIKFNITSETLEKLKLLQEIINYERDNDKLTIEDVVKGSLFHYLNRFYTNRINEAEIEKLIPLGSHGELVNCIGKFMNDNNITPSHVANETQITRAMMSNILNNKKPPSLDVFIRIWVALGCPPLHKLLKREINNFHTCQEESHIP